MARKLLIACIPLAAVLGLAATGGVASAKMAATETTATAISTRKAGQLGTLLVSDDGNTVYTLKPSKTSCDATCLKARPPVLLPQGVTSATAGTGVEATKLGTTTTPDGALQVTYSGKPLYWFSKDKAPGQVHGNMTDKWGKWSTVAAVKGSSGSGKNNGGSGGDSNAGNGGSAF